MKNELSPVKSQPDKKYMSLIDMVDDEPVNTAERLINISENAMQERVSVWQRHRNKYRRGLFYLKQVTGIPLYFTNYIYGTIEAVKSNLTNRLPTMLVRPRGADDELAADLLTRVLVDQIDRAKLKKATKSVVHHGLTCSMGWYKVSYDDDVESNRVDCVAPEDMLLDPMAHDMEDLRWIGQRHRDVSVDKIYATYGEWVQGDPDGINRDSNSLNDSVKFGYLNEADRESSRDLVPTYDVYEMWIKDWEKDVWRIVTVAGKTVLRNEDSPYDHNQCPFIPWFDVEDDAAENMYIRGIGEIEEIEPLQDRADSLDLRIYKNITLLSNRQKYVSAQSGLNAEMLDNTAGRTYTVNGDPGKAVYYDIPPSMSSDVYGYRNQTESLIQNVSGVFDVTQGKRPVGITAGRAVAELKESSDVRLNAKAETLAYAHEQVATLMLQNILQFFEGEHVIRLTDSGDDKTMRVIDDYPTSLKESGQLDPVTGKKMKLDDEGMDKLKALREEWKAENGIGLVLSDVTFDWDIKASTDTALPNTRAERGQMAADFFRLGAIDRKALLDATDFPDKDKILDRLQKDVTGKDAGQNEAESGQQVQAVVQAIGQSLVQSGIDPNQVQQIMNQAMQSLQGQSAPQGQQGGNFPPQMTQ